MTKPDELYTQWLDGCADSGEAAHLEADPAARADRDAWRALRAVLVDELAAPPLPHADFVNAQVLEAIRRETRPIARPAGFLRRIVYAGIGSLVAAALLTLAFLPGVLHKPSESELISQVVSARAGNPRVFVSSFQAPDDRGVVLWVEGAKFISPAETIR